MTELKITTEVITQQREKVPFEAEFSEDMVRFSLDGRLIYAMDFVDFKEFSETINKLGEVITLKKKK